MSRLSQWLRTRRQPPPGMEYLEALRIIHTTIAPTGYFEIGVRLGTSMALSQVPSIGVDPAPMIEVPLLAPVRLYEMTSDRFFAEETLDQPIDFAFIDGMHQVEFVLRDFMNIEAHSHPGTVVAIDDVLPEDIRLTPREQIPGAWTGDVYRIIPLLRQYRPDLDVRVYDVTQKGIGVITGLDRTSRILPALYDRIVAELDRGAFLARTAKAIRKAVGPLPTNQLAPDLAHFARSRRRA